MVGFQSLSFLIALAPHPSLVVSPGLHVSRWISLLYQPTAETVTAGILSADTSLAGLIAHTGSGSGPSGDLADRMDVFVQAAVLYTSARGERRVRVCNINLGRPSRLVANVFKGADHEAGVALFLKEGSREPSSSRCIVNDTSHIARTFGSGFRRDEQDLEQHPGDVRSVVHQFALRISEELRGRDSTRPGMP